MKLALKFWKVHGGSVQHVRRGMASSTMVGCYSVTRHTWNALCVNVDESFGHAARPALEVRLL